jgi:hypothetical protein
VKDNYVYNAGGTPIKFIWDNWNVVNEGNKSAKSRIVPPFVDEVGPKGTATNGIDLETNRLTGSVIHYSDSKLVTRLGNWQSRIIGGQGGLFRYNLLEADENQKAEITYALPIIEEGTYQIALVYKPDGKYASNAKIAIHHAQGIAQTNWNMKKGNQRGFAVAAGKYPFKASLRRWSSPTKAPTAW